MSPLAATVEIAEDFNEIEENPALAEWVAGIKEDLKALDAGTLQTEPLEDFVARRKEYWRKMKEENAGAFNPAR